MNQLNWNATEVNSLPDEKIVGRIKAENNQELFSILYSRYHQRVVEKCNSLLKDKILAVELSQEIFTKAFEKLDSFRGEALFSSWLYAITYNHCIEYLRHKQKMHYPEWNNSHEISEIVDESEKDFETLKYNRLLQIFDKIHPEEKALLLMKYQDNLSLKTILETLQISESAAKMRIKRAKARVLYLYKINYEKGY